MAFMKNKQTQRLPTKDIIEIRKDLQDGARGKDLSYLNELPQMGGYEGVKAGAPPPKKITTKRKDKNH